MKSVRCLTAWLAVAVLPAVSLGASDSRSTRLIDAVKGGDKAAVRTLLLQPIDVNAAEPDGTTPLVVAAQRDDLDTVQALIRAGANVKAANRYGANALTAACINGNAPMIEALLTAGADANSALPEGETALMTAARTGNVDAVKALAAHGANVNAKESWRGQTALMWAAAEDHAAVIRLLKELGADLNTRSNGGFTALLFAARAGRVEAVNALLASGANVNDTIQAARRAPASGMATGAGGAVPPGGLTSYYPGAAARAASGASAPAGASAPNTHSRAGRPRSRAGAIAGAGPQHGIPGWESRCQRHECAHPRHRQRALRPRCRSAGTRRRSECRWPGMDRAASDRLDAQAADPARPPERRDDRYHGQPHAGEGAPGSRCRPERPAERRTG